MKKIELIIMNKREDDDAFLSINDHSDIVLNKSKYQKYVRQQCVKKIYVKLLLDCLPHNDN